MWSFNSINLEHLNDEIEYTENKNILKVEDELIEKTPVKPKENGKLLIELNPQLEIEFKQLLLERKKAYITTFYKNGTSEKKIWKAKRFSESSNVLGNLRTRAEYKNGKWQEDGVTKIYVSIDEFE